ncbi:MAG: hypothetical protein JW860_04740 [Sedimentisphaerales bacterium]|nr:hypothetical protein [Sedimentisphaerales bacterium]
MRNRFFLVSLYFIIGCCLAGLVSCKKESGSTISENFDASLDGIAVRPLPEMDLQLAERIEKEDRAITSLDDVTTEDSVPDEGITESEAPSKGTDEDFDIFGTEEDVSGMGSDEPNSY